MARRARGGGGRAGARGARWALHVLLAALLARRAAQAQADARTVVFTEAQLKRALVSSTPNIVVRGVLYVSWDLDIWAPKLASGTRELYKGLQNGTWVKTADFAYEPTVIVRSPKKITASPGSSATIVFAPSKALEGGGGSQAPLSSDDVFVGIEGAAVVFQSISVVNLFDVKGGEVKFPIWSKGPFTGVMLNNVDVVQSLGTKVAVARHLENTKRFPAAIVDEAFWRVDFLSANSTAVRSDDGTYAQCCPSRGLAYHHCKGLDHRLDAPSALACLELCCRVGAAACTVWQFRLMPHQTQDTQSFVTKGSCFIGAPLDVRESCYSSLSSQDDSMGPPPWFNSTIELQTVAGEQLAQAWGQCGTAPYREHLINYASAVESQGSPSHRQSSSAGGPYHLVHVPQNDGEPSSMIHTFVLVATVVCITVSMCCCVLVRQHYHSVDEREAELEQRQSRLKRMMRSFERSLWRPPKSISREVSLNTTPRRVSLEPDTPISEARYDGDSSNDSNRASSIIELRILSNNDSHKKLKKLTPEACMGRVRTLSEQAAAAATQHAAPPMHDELQVTNTLHDHRDQDLDLDPVAVRAGLGWMRHRPELPDEVGECIGKGMFGLVFRASSGGESGGPQSGTVAVKVTVFDKFERAKDPQRTLDDMSQPERRSKTALAEMAILKMVNHPNIIRLYATHHHCPPDGPKEYVVLVQEYCDGGNLKTMLLRDAYGDSNFLRDCRGSCEKALRQLDVSLQVLSGITYLHQSGIVHGDLKSDNVLLRLEHRDPSGGEPDLYKWDYVTKLGDFGLSTTLDEGTDRKTVGICGTPTHLAPELFKKHEGVISRASDMFAYGVLIWEIVTMRQPWDGMSLDTVKHRVVDLRETLQLDPALVFAPALDTVARNCFHYSPDERITALAALNNLSHMWTSAIARAREVHDHRVASGDAAAAGSAKRKCLSVGAL